MKQAYPLSWPAGWKRTDSPTRSRWGKWNSKPSVASALDIVIPELNRMGARDIIISTNIRTRKDNYPLSNQSEPRDSGVAVYFTYKKQETVIACDAFNKVGCNLYSIGKTIEAIRGIDRWGCSELMNKAFTGFTALPENASPSTWFTVLEMSPDANAVQIKERYRELSKIYHPDVPTTGNAEKFTQIKFAYEDAMKNF